MKLFLLLSLFASAPKVYPARFVECYDGDTCTFDITVSDEQQDLPFNLRQRIVLTKTNQKVRLCDINAPEMKGPANAAATKARDDLVDWIRNAKTLELQIAQRTSCADALCDKTEKYGRLLGWIVADGINLNQQQLQRGNAAPYILCPH